MTTLVDTPAPSQSVSPEALWPKRVSLFGVHVSVTDYDTLVSSIVRAAKDNRPGAVSLFSVHSVIEAANDPELRRQVNQFDAIGPDGQPVRWAMNWFYGTGLKERVYGPETTLRICESAAREQVPIYLYGSTPDVVETFRDELVRRYPGLIVVGAESPPFRKLSDKESDELVQRVTESGAKIFFIGLGCPKQDRFAFEYKDRLPCVQVAVGAAFDFIAGKKKTAPSWMQKRGLEWLFRLQQEPGRLWRRYLVTNSQFVWKSLMTQLFGHRVR
jgi:N-acetylglucosaminyldiphosphoundecaprenol N-acetyl-beta-D-mannosaminyltransferase